MSQNSNVFNFISYKWHIDWISLHAFASILLSQEVHFFQNHMFDFSGQWCSSSGL